MTDEEVEKIIRSNMSLQMNLAGIRADFEEKLKRPWVGLTENDILEAAVKSQEGISPRNDTLRFATAIEAKLKEKNT